MPIQYVVRKRRRGKTRCALRQTITSTARAISTPRAAIPKPSRPTTYLSGCAIATGPRGIMPAAEQIAHLPGPRE